MAHETKALLALAAGILVTAFSAVLAVPASAAEIVVAIGTEPSTLDPQLRDDGGERAVNDNIYETLMARTADGTLIPGLAAESPVQVGPTTWEFRLRPGISFSNGEAFDADAVVRSVERIIDPDFKSEQMSYFGTIKAAVKVDALTVRIETNAPDPILPSRMYWMKMVPAAYSSSEDFMSAPVGTGPYLLDHWTRGVEIVLKANPDYWGGETAIDQVTYHFISQAGTRLSGLMAGEFDLITYMAPEFAPSVPKVESVQGLETSVIILSTENPVVNDPRVRLALNLAVDRKALADSLFLGYAAVTQGQVTNPKSFGFDADIPAYAYDPDQARALIAEAGAEGATITLVGESGRWLKDREMLEAVAAYWDAVGVKTNLEILEFSNWLERFFDKSHRPDAIFVVSSDELLDADRPATALLQTGASAASNDDRDMALAIEAARAETDVDTRRAMYAEILGKAHDQAYLVPLLGHKDIYGMSERLDWTPRIDGKLILREMSVTP